MNGDFLTATVAAAGAVVQQQQAAGAAVAASTRPAPVEHSPGPCPLAEESLAACVALGLLEIVGPPRPGEGKPHQYRALQRGRRGPHDPGIVADDGKGGEA